MSLTIISPTNGTVISGSSVTLLGTSTQSVDGQVMPAQSFSLTKDVSTVVPGASFSLSIQNSSGDSASVSLVKQQVESADGSTVANNSGKVLYDASLNAFTVTSGVVYKNGSTIGYSAGITTLLYYGKKFYSKYVSSDGLTTSWWLLDSTGNWGGPLTDPRYPVLPAYGVNGHMTWSWSNASAYQKTNWTAAVNKMKDLGMKAYRNGFSCYFDSNNNLTSSDAPVFVDFITNYASPNGIVVSPVLLPNFDPTCDGVTATETSAYNNGFITGKTAATALKGLVPHYEVGNEMCSYAILGGSHRGNLNSDYDNRRFTIVRGSVRGMIDGIRSVDTVTPIAMGAGTWLHTALFDMLRAGTQPDGTSGCQTVDWDITCWHWYTNNYAPNDDIENPTDQGSFNVLAHIAAWGKPIHINECGSVSSAYADNETNIANAIVGNYCIGRFYSVRNTYKIKHISYYQLFDAAGNGVPSTDNEMKFGLVQSDCSTNKARYATLKSFVASHAM